MSRLNPVIDTLAGGGVVFGTPIMNGSYAEAQRIGELDYDFVVVDMEHAAFDLMALPLTLQALLSRRRIAESGEIRPRPMPLVRIPPNGREMNEWIIKQALDAGAYGIVAPHVTSVREAAAVVSAMSYPTPEDPTGHRGWTPPLRYWGLTDPAEYVVHARLWPKHADGSLMFVLLVESDEGVKQLAETLANVPVSAVVPGFADMASSLGHAADWYHPVVQRRVQDVLEIADNAKVPCGIVANAASLTDRLDQGFRLLWILPERSDVGLEIGRDYTRPRATGRE